MIRERSTTGHVGQQRRARCVHQKQACGEQCEAAAARHEQCLSGRASSLRSFVLEPDEQIRRKPGQLPEDEQGDDVVAEDDAEHRAHERKQRDVESSRVRMMLEIFRWRR